jgi:hypothetical protein
MSLWVFERQASGARRQADQAIYYVLHVAVDELDTDNIHDLSSAMATFFNSAAPSGRDGSGDRLQRRRQGFEGCRVDSWGLFLPVYM